MKLSSWGKSKEIQCELTEWKKKIGKMDQWLRDIFTTAKVYIYVVGKSERVKGEQE